MDLNRINFNLSMILSLNKWKLKKDLCWKSKMKRCLKINLMWNKNEDMIVFFYFLFWSFENYNNSNYQELCFTVPLIPQRWSWGEFLWCFSCWRGSLKMKVWQFFCSWDWVLFCKFSHLFWKQPKKNAFSMYVRLRQSL